MKKPNHAGEKLSVSAICAHLGLSKARFYLLRKEIPEFLGDDLDAIRTAYIEHLREAATGAHELSGKFRGGKETIDADFERARLLRARAAAQEMANKHRDGELIAVDEVAELWTRVLMRLKARTLQIPSKIFPLVMASRGPAETKAVLEAGVHEALMEMSEFDPDEIASAKEPRS